MWRSSTLGEYFECLGVEIRRQRMKYNLTADSRGVVLMDKAPQHGNATFKKLRERFEQTHKVIFLHGGSYQYVPVPGGPTF